MPDWTEADDAMLDYDLSHLPNPLPCGCGAVGIPELDHGEARERFSSTHVRFCPLHQAAGELLEALKSLLSWVELSFGVKAEQQMEDHPMRPAYAAIAKATRTWK